MSQNEEEAQFVEEALRCADAGNAGHWPTVAGYLADEVRRLRTDLETSRERGNNLADEVRRLRAGAEPYDKAETWGIQLTPGQLWHKLLSDTEDGRLAFLVSMLETARSAHLCFTQDHQGHIDALTDAQVRLERALRLDGPRPLTALVTAVEALRSVMVDGIAARTQVPGTVDEVELEDFPQERDTVAKVAEQLKEAGIDTSAACGYEWPGDEMHDHVCAVINPLHAVNHSCEQCGEPLTHIEAEKIAEANQ